VISDYLVKVSTFQEHRSIEFPKRGGTEADFKEGTSDSFFFFVTYDYECGLGKKVSKVFICSYTYLLQDYFLTLLYLSTQDLPTSARTGNKQINTCIRVIDLGYRRRELSAIKPSQLSSSIPENQNSPIHRK
jgi:hypothetical protein